MDEGVTEFTMEKTDTDTAQEYYPPEPLQPAVARGAIQTGMPQRIQAEKIFQASIWTERVRARSGSNLALRRGVY